MKYPGKPNGTHYRLAAPCLILLFFSSCFLAAQNRIDSLRLKLNTSVNDTAKINSLNVIAKYYLDKDLGDSCVYYANMAVAEAQKKFNCENCERSWYLDAAGTAFQTMGHVRSNEYNYPEANAHYYKSLELHKTANNFAGLSQTQNSLGMVQREQGNYYEALKFHNQAVSSARIAKDQKKIASALNEIGIVYEYLGDYSKSLDHYLKALKIFEEEKFLRGVAAVLLNVGLSYKYQEDYASALKYYTESLKIRRELGNKRDISAVLSNLGGLYMDIGYNSETLAEKTGNYQKAMEIHSEALTIRRESGDKQGVVTSLSAIGNLYDYQSRIAESSKEKNELLAKALEFNLQSLEIKKSLGESLIIGHHNVGIIYFMMKDYTNALKYNSTALQLAKAAGAKRQYAAIYASLANIYEATGATEKAFEHYKLHIAYRDSVSNEENTKKIVQQQMQYDFDKKTVADSIKNAEEKKIDEINHQAQIRNQQLYTYAGLGGFLIMIVIAAISFVAFRNKKKANSEIAKQKLRVEEKQQEILDSIYYARRIQRALITNEKYIEKNLRKLRR